MIVKCIRCGTEFNSPQPGTHLCPNCHFVFAEGDSKEQLLQKKKAEPVAPPDPADAGIAPSPALLEIRHRLLEENTTKCAFHPDVDSLGNCKRCGRPLCYACANDEGGGLLCEPCEQGHSPMDFPPPPTEKPLQQDKPASQIAIKESVSKALARGPYVPWEYRRQTGYLRAFFTTFRQSLFSPLRFFKKVPITADYRSPLLYGLIWTLIGMCGGVIWRVATWIHATVAAPFSAEAFDLSLYLTQRVVSGIILILASPLVGLAFILGSSALYHVFVVLMTSRHARFQSTLRVVCYSAGTNIFFFLPFVGAFIGGIWSLALVTIGLREIHRISYPTSVTIALIPYTVLLVLCLAFMFWAISGYDFGLLDFVARLLFRRF